MDNEITSGAMQKLLGVTKVALNDLAKRGIVKRCEGVVTLSQTERNLPTIANVDARDFSDLACWLIVQIGPISLNVTTPSRSVLRTSLGLTSFVGSPLTPVAPEPRDHLFKRRFPLIFAEIVQRLLDDGE